MKQIEGKCHCGNISYKFHWPLETLEIPVRACSCSFCIKHGGVYTSHPQGKLEAAVVDETLVTKYIFGTRTAEFFICSQCGAVPFVTSLIEEKLYAVVNVNTFENVDRSLFSKAVTDFDGETTGSRLERRMRNWVPNVTLEIQANPKNS